MLFQPETVKEFAPSDLVGINPGILADILSRQARAQLVLDATIAAASGTPADDTLSLTVGNQTAVFTFVNGVGTARTGALAANLDMVGGALNDFRVFADTLLFGLNLLVAAGDFDETVAARPSNASGHYTVAATSIDSGTAPVGDTVIPGETVINFFGGAPISLAVGPGVEGLSAK